MVAVQNGDGGGGDGGDNDDDGVYWLHYFLWGRHPSDKNKIKTWHHIMKGKLIWINFDLLQYKLALSKNHKWPTGGWCGWMYVGAATGTLATSKEFGRLVTGTALTWSGISTSMMTGGPGWGGWCCRGTVEPILRGQKLLFVGGWKSRLCDEWWRCRCCCWTKGQPWLDEFLKWKTFHC